MDKPLVSIIIPLYNASPFISKCLESAINQTWPQKEIIVVDDGSTDNSFEIAKTYQSKSVQIHQQQNKGASAARNLGLVHAKGDYIQFLDADDFLSDNKIELQVEVLEKNPGYLALCETIHFFNFSDILQSNRDKSWYNQTTDQPFDFLLKLIGGEVIGKGYGGMIQPNAWLVPSSIINKTGPWNEELSVDDDGEYFCRILLNTKGICFVPQTFNYYRKYLVSGANLSLSQQLTYKGYSSMIKAIDLKYEYLQTKVAVDLLNKMFIAPYVRVGIATFPKFNDLSRYAINKAKQLGAKKMTYSGGPVSLMLSRYFGWRVIRLISYWRFGF